jgi:tRNA (Thr-GGU) A37 N-methylase
VLDGTPLLDVKPYIPEFDVRKVDKIGWIEEKIQKLDETEDDGRFTGETG